MPRTKLASPAQKEAWAKNQVQTRFERKLRTYRALYELTERDICAGIGMSQGTFIKRKKDPEEFTVSEIRKLCSILNWNKAIVDYIWNGANDPDQMATGNDRAGKRMIPMQGKAVAY